VALRFPGARPNTGVKTAKTRQNVTKSDTKDLNSQKTVKFGKEMVKFLPAVAAAASIRIAMAKIPVFLRGFFVGVIVSHCKSVSCKLIGLPSSLVATSAALCSSVLQPHKSLFSWQRIACMRTEGGTRKEVMSRSPFPAVKIANPRSAAFFFAWFAYFAVKIPLFFAALLCGCGASRAGLCADHFAPAPHGCLAR